MKFFVFLGILFQNFLFACAICVAEVPQVLVHVDVYAQKETTKFDITWNFHKEFMDSLVQYDVNENGIYDEEEKAMIKESLIDYLNRFHYLTDIQYKQQKQLTDTKYIQKITPIVSELIMTKTKMSYHYTFELPEKLKNNYELYVGFYDEGGNFDFILQNIVLHNYPYLYSLNKQFINSTITFSDPNIKIKKNKIIEKVEDIQFKEIDKSKVKEELTENTENTEIISLEVLKEQLTKLKKELKDILKNIKATNDILSYLWLLFFSFLYGIIHAIGPGHGKSLVSSYFLNQNKSYVKAFSISSLIAVVHTFSAFILTYFIYTSVGFIFNSTVANVELIATKVSAGIIILIAIYLIYRKIRNSKPKINFQKNDKKFSFTTSKVTHTESLSCACNSCKTTSTDIGVILAAGIIPCPGTITIFLFTFGLGIYFVGFLSALFMSLGMSLIIFLTAILSVKIRNSTTQNTTLIKILEYSSLGFILFLGVFLLIIS